MVWKLRHYADTNDCKTRICFCGDCPDIECYLCFRTFAIDYADFRLNSERIEYVADLFRRVVRYVTYIHLLLADAGRTCGAPCPGGHARWTPVSSMSWVLNWPTLSVATHWTRPQPEVPNITYITITSRHRCIFCKASLRVCSLTDTTNQNKNAIFCVVYYMRRKNDVTSIDPLRGSI